MSVISIVNTSAGLVVAADGRSTLSSIDGPGTDRASDFEQKIYKASYKGREFAWAITGLAYGNSFNLKDETVKALAPLATEKFTPAETSVANVAKRINESIKNARADGRLPWFPSHPLSPDKRTIAIVFLVGFFRSKTQPWIVSMTFLHNDQVLAEPIVETETAPNDYILSGPVEIAQRYSQGPSDPLVGKYFRPTGPSTAQGLQFVTGYIEACKDPLARQVHPICERVGGHTHAAAVTPDGFRWLIEPRSA